MGKFKPLAVLVEEYEHNLCVLRARHAEVEALLSATEGNEIRLKLAHRRALLDRMVFEGECAVREMREYGK